MPVQMNAMPSSSGCCVSARPPAPVPRSPDAHSLDGPPAPPRERWHGASLSGYRCTRRRVKRCSAAAKRSPAARRTPGAHGVKAAPRKKGGRTRRR